MFKGAVIPRHEGYLINESGKIWNAKTNRPINWRIKTNSAPYVKIDGMTTPVYKILPLCFDKYELKDQAYLEIKNNRIWLYIGRTEEYSFTSFAAFDKFIKTHKENKKYDLIIYTSIFRLLYNYMYNRKDFAAITLKDRKDPLGFRLTGCVFRDMKYYYGSDRFTTQSAINEINSYHPTRGNSSYTGYIGRAINIDSIKAATSPVESALLTHMLMDTSQGAIIYSDKTREFTNAHSYDGVSAYPSILLEKVPTRFNKVQTLTKDEYNNSNNVYFGRIRIKNFKAKNSGFLPLYCGKRDNYDNCVQIGKRLLAGSYYEYYGFIKHELRLLKEHYEFEEIIIDRLYQCEMNYLPQEVCNTIKNLYDRKLAAKGTDSYDSYKQLFNRVFGFFLTTKTVNGRLKVRDKTIPYYLGLWVISKQRQIMLNAIAAVGLNNVIACHTDGIKTNGNFDNVFDSLNKTRGITYKDLGQWKKEAVIERIRYFSHIKAKYIENGELKMKHGGISKDDVDKFLLNKTYDSVTPKTNFQLTIKLKIVENNKGISIEHIYSNTTIGDVNVGDV